MSFWVSVVLGLLLLVMCLGSREYTRTALPVLESALQFVSMPGEARSESLGRVKRHVSPIIVKQVAAQQGWKCQVCGRMLDENYEIDHIVPLRSGGTNERKNLQALCKTDHKLKSAAESRKPARARW